MDLLIYGSYGYTGDLIADTAADRGHDPTLAGRNERKVADQAAELGFDHRVFDLDDTGAVHDALDAHDAVLNCAGPFVQTYEPLVEACIETGTHYLDITGEIVVFQAIAEYDDAASEAGVMLMPGVGFDVVPTDCLAAHLHERLPEATHLALGFDAMAGISPGTAKTVIDSLDEPGYVREGGLLESVPAAHNTRRIDFGRGEKSAATIPWGDLVTAYHTTGIENVEVYTALPEPAIWAMRASRPFTPLLSLPPLKSGLELLVDTTVSGPSERERETGRSFVWGEASTAEGERAVSRLETPETYALTVETALEIAGRVLDGDAPEGFQTPAGAYGPDLILSIDGTERHDE
ncbi:saccharopine dehydrogenase family protein [Halorientalis litorea]|uniref:saccharopine dehydrogenase family protein n=1 Tax=Halorientalis litorea TaxID=2931977 RepID=UPI001FF38283|nr:saccharopine dehydrogenase NADP-binding domain-containing protein [Halorientalis litorea]